MKFIGLEKIDQGRYITRYDVTYETEDGRTKTYEMVSRNGDIRTFEELHGSKPEGVIMILHDETGEKVLLNREYRLSMGEWVYNFPAGLVDPGEDIETAARRELWEETGLSLDTVEDVLNVCYTTVGFSNERTVTLVGRASGEFSRSTSDVEEIEAGWFTKEEVKELMKDQFFAARTQAYCYLWCK